MTVFKLSLGWVGVGEGHLGGLESKGLLIITMNEIRENDLNFAMMPVLEPRFLTINNNWDSEES